MRRSSTACSASAVYALLRTVRSDARRSGGVRRAERVLLLPADRHAVHGSAFVLLHDADVSGRRCGNGRGGPRGVGRRGSPCRCCFCSGISAVRFRCRSARLRRGLGRRAIRAAHRDGSPALAAGTAVRARVCLRRRSRAVAVRSGAAHGRTRSRCRCKSPAIARPGPASIGPLRIVARHAGALPALGQTVVARSCAGRDHSAAVRPPVERALGAAGRGCSSAASCATAAFLAYHADAAADRASRSRWSIVALAIAGVRETLPAAMARAAHRVLASRRGSRYGRVRRQRWTARGIEHVQFNAAEADRAEGHLPRRPRIHALEPRSVGVRRRRTDGARSIPPRVPTATSC